MIEFHSIYYYEFKGGETPAERAVVAMLESQVRGSRGRGSVMINYIQCIMYKNLLLFDFFLQAMDFRNGFVRLCYNSDFVGKLYRSVY